MTDAPDSPLSASGQEVFEALRDDIVFGRLNPRERLVEADLVLRFRTHRAAVREALLALEQAGLVDRQRNKGASVRDLQPEHVEQIYAVRMLLETAAVEAMPFPLQPNALAELIAIQNEHQKAVSDQDLRRIFKHNNCFHRHLYAQLRNPIHTEMIELCAVRALTVRFHPYMDPTFLTKVCADHWAMIEACEHCDRPRLVALVREHLPLAKDRYLKTYSASLSQSLVSAGRG